MNYDNYVTAILFLKPTARNGLDFYVTGAGEIGEWNSAKLGVQPTITEIQAAIPLALAAIAANAYIGKRAAIYPPKEMYLDAKVKQARPDPVIRAEGVAQEAEYYALCLAVKAEIPKP
jgi:hypothetical protein